MFAPGAGRPLAAGATVLLLIALLTGARYLPLDAPIVGLLLGGTAAWAFFAMFFRDPDRPVGDGVVSPADGRLREIADEGEQTRFSIFMNVTDVHVNRLPLDGTFAAIATGGAGYRPAYRPDALHNVARTYDLATEYGPVRVVQFTGILARRLVSFVRVGDRRRRGERFGMIVLGSRVDVLVPRARFRPVATVGARVWAGRTTLARERP